MQEMVCKLFTWLATGSAATATFHLLLISLDRVMSIKAPVHYDTHLKLGKLRLQCGKISVALATFTYLFSATSVSHVSIHSGSGLCELEVSTAFQYSTTFFVLAITQVVPFLVLLFSNLTFSISLLARRSRRDAERTTGNQGAMAIGSAASANCQPTAAKIEKDYVKMLFALTSSFLLFNVGSIVPLLATSNQTEATSRWGLSLSLLFTSVNYSSNFLFYFISGPMFRQALKTALKEILKDGSNGRHEVNTEINSSTGQMRVEVSTTETSLCQEVYMG